MLFFFFFDLFCWSLGIFFYLHNGFSLSLCNLVLARNELELLPVQTVTSTDPLKLNNTSLEVVKRLFVPGFSYTAVIFLPCTFSASVKDRPWLHDCLSDLRWILHFKQIKYWTGDTPMEVLRPTIKQWNKQILPESEHLQLSKAITGCKDFNWDDILSFSLFTLFTGFGSQFCVGSKQLKM